MSKEKKGALARKKTKKSVPAVKESQPGSIQEFNKLLDTFRNEIVWDPFRDSSGQSNTSFPRDTLR